MTKQDLTRCDNLKEFVVAVECDKDNELEVFLGAAVSLAKDYFDRAGEIRPHWMIQRANGSIAHWWLSDQPTGGSVLDMPGQGHMQDRVVAMAAQWFKGENAVRYAFICEAWKSQNRCSRPSLDPNRIEVVRVIVEDRVRSIGTTMQIIRPARQKPYLSEPTDVVVVGACRWTGLLAKSQ